jgi:acyl-[acyl carrier protein]--UDP-N-acetylglucosamine O-acyltransferase
MSQGLTAISQHVAPWSLIQGVNQVVGMNRVGLRRHDELTDQDREQLTEAFALVYRRGLSRADALAEMDRRDPWGPAARRFTDFVRRVYEARPPHRRGLAGLRSGR